MGEWRVTMQFDDAHFSVALADEEHAWRWRWLVTVRAPWGEFEAFLQTNAQAGGISRIWPQSQSDRDAAIAAGSFEVEIISRAGHGASWSVRARVDADDLWMPLGFAAILQDVKFERPSNGLPAYFRIVFRGLRLPGYTFGTWIGSDGVARNRGHAPIRLFGRDVVIAEIAENDDDDACFVGVTIGGEWLEQPELDALEIVLFILAGTGGVRQCIESYDADGRWLRRHFHRLAHSLAPKREEVFGRADFMKPTFWVSVVGMIERAKTLILAGFPLRAILYQLFASQQPVPELEITLLAVALDGIKNAVVVKIKGEGKVMDQKAFDSRIASVVTAAEAEFSKPEEADALELILRRIKDANNWSDRKRWERFWRDHAGYRLTGKESEVLKHRGPAIHDAYILDTEYDLALDDDPQTDRRPYEDRLRELAHDASVFRNVVVRVLLMLLGYEGDFINATGPAGSALSIGTAGSVGIVAPAAAKSANELPEAGGAV